MQPRSESAARGLLTVTAEGGSWGFPSSAVLGVETVAEQPAGELPPDLLTLLGAASTKSPREGRVLVVQAAGQQRKVRVEGTLQLLEGAAVELLPLPAEVRAASPLITHIALVGGKPQLFVVSPERLLEVLRG
jgi:hypothetical protein